MDISTTLSQQPKFGEIILIPDFHNNESPEVDELIESDPKVFLDARINNDKDMVVINGQDFERFVKEETQLNIPEEYFDLSYSQAFGIEYVDITRSILEYANNSVETFLQKVENFIKSHQEEGKPVRVINLEA